MSNFHQTFLIGLSKIDNLEISDAFIWLPAQTWFEFVWRRLDAIGQCQMQLYQRQKPAANYGIMSGIFAFLMQSVLFTPAIVRGYVQESLTQLNFKAMVNRFGIFFLHDLDMSKELCLPEVVEVDDVNILRTLGLNPGQAQVAVSGAGLGWQDAEDGGDNDDQYPLGYMEPAENSIRGAAMGHFAQVVMASRTEHVL